MARQRVSERVRAMEQDGFIRRYQIVPNFRHLGLESTCYYYSFPDAERAVRAMEKAAPLQGVAGCYAFVNGGLCVNFVHEGPVDLQRKLQLLVNLAEPEVAVQKFYDLETPEVSRPLSRLDWQIVQALRGHARRPLAEVASELGVTTRTVRRRFEAMGSEGSYFIVPAVDPGVVHGLMFYLGFHLDAEAPRDATQRLREVTADHWLAEVFTSTVGALGPYSLLLFARSMAEVDGLREQCDRVPGVRSATTYLFRKALESNRWLDEAIAQQVEAASAKVPA